MASANPFRRVVDFFNGVDEEEEFEEMDTPTAPQAPAPPKRQRGPLQLHTSGEGGMQIRHPRSLEDRMAVGMDLKQRRTVTLDLTRLSETDARYFLEFVYGVVFALDATAEKVTDGIYLIAPRGVAVQHDTEAGEDAPAGTSALARSFAASAGGRDEQEELFWPGRR